ncbi:hypothetical protein GF312_07495 [Candidatus Poribacteria bacterium]|nr:hypothetical protein [Candidatus Poribacteria bacterium]
MIFSISSRIRKGILVKQKEISAEEENKLIEKFQKGDKSVLVKLSEKYNEILFKYIIRQIKTRTYNYEDDARNILHNTWIKVTDKINKYDPQRGTFGKYVYTLAKNEIEDYFPQRKKEPRYDSLDSAINKTSEFRRPDIILLKKEELEMKKRAFMELFRILFLCGGYPHQQLAFAYSKLIYGKSKRRSKEKDSSRINGGMIGSHQETDRKQGHKPLRSLADSFLKDYEPELDTKELEKLRNHLKPLYKRLNMRVNSLFADLPNKIDLEEILNILGNNIVGTTCLRDYSKEGQYTNSISDWCDKIVKSFEIYLNVKIREKEEQPRDVYEIVDIVKTSATNPRNCNKCKLRNIPPCDQKNDSS